MKTYRYVLVRFDDTAKKLYSYRTNNKKLKVHDLVIVPVGKDNHPGVAEIFPKMRSLTHWRKRSK